MINIAIQYIIFKAQKGEKYQQEIVEKTKENHYLNSTSLQQISFLTHKNHNPKIKPLNFRRRILKSRKKERLWP